MGKIEGYEVWKIVNSFLVWIFDFILLGEWEGMFLCVFLWINNNGYIIMYCRIWLIIVLFLWVERRRWRYYVNFGLIG